MCPQPLYGNAQPQLYILGCLALVLLPLPLCISFAPRFQSVTVAPSDCYLILLRSKLSFNLYHTYLETSVVLVSVSYAFCHPSANSPFFDNSLVLVPCIVCSVFSISPPVRACLLSLITTRRLRSPVYHCRCFLKSLLYTHS